MLDSSRKVLAKARFSRRSDGIVLEMNEYLQKSKIMADTAVLDYGITKSK